MRLTRKKAIALCIELWTWLAKTGSLLKTDWPKSKEYGWIGCFFCEYEEQQEERYGYDPKKKDCLYCPLERAGLSCGKPDSPYQKWDDAKTLRTRKKYAKLFLEQIKSIEQRT